MSKIKSCIKCNKTAHNLSPRNNLTKSPEVKKVSQSVDLSDYTSVGGSYKVNISPHLLSPKGPQDCHDLCTYFVRNCRKKKVRVHEFNARRNLFFMHTH